MRVSPLQLDLEKDTEKIVPQARRGRSNDRSLPGTSLWLSCRQVFTGDIIVVPSHISLSSVFAAEIKRLRNVSVQRNYLGTGVLPFVLFISAPTRYPTWIRYR